MTSSLTLVCFVSGMPFEDTFLVEVEREDTVYTLKKLIHKERPRFFKGTDVSDIKLWKLNIPEDDEEALQKSPLKNSIFLFPTWKTSKAFEEEPRDGCVSVIIEISGFAGRNIPHPLLKTRREDDDDDAALIKDLHPPSQAIPILVNAEYDRKTRKLTLAENTSWLGGIGFSRHSLYVREHYEGLWSKICWGMSFSDDDVKNLFVPDDAHQQDLSSFKIDCEEGFRGYIVNGTPGIGKSYFGLYILWRLRCKNDTSVVWYAGHKWFVFNPDGSIFVSLVMPNECLDTLNWLLIDAQTPPLAGARTILLTSPRHERFKEFANLEYVRTVCMPLWDTEEILALRNAEFAASDQNHVLELCKFWGPVPKWVLRCAKNTDLHAQQKNLIEGLCKQTLNELVRNLADETYPYGLVFGKIIHMEINEMYSFHHPRFASTSIANQSFGCQGEERYQQTRINVHQN